MVPSWFTIVTVCEDEVQHGDCTLALVWQLLPQASEERAGTFGLRAELGSLKSELESLRERLEEAGTQKRRLETDVAKKDNEKKYLNHLLDESYRLWKTDNSERGKWGTST